MASTVAWISRFAGELALKVQPSKDPNAQATLEAIERVEDLCAETLLKLGVTRNDGTPSGPSPYGARTLLSTSVI
jgi:hypothetical protein